MSNRRKPRGRNAYGEFLRSPAWFARRARWFRRQEQLGHPLHCLVCGRAARKADLELHHLDYSGVRIVDGVWRAYEHDSDLVPMHPACHEVLHRMLDRDRVLAFHRTRRVASAIAIARMRDRLARRDAA
ncbi:MAG: hypothetical protein ACTHNQ_19365 [Microbacterium sp.]|uniref:hypothetical protein n=1 Tax=Microbacterium sp. TaxID=51671 RepID=UPI003F7CFEC9